MKKAFFLLLAVAMMAITACNEKPAKNGEGKNQTPTEAKKVDPDKVTPVDLNDVKIEELKIKPTGDVKKDAEALAVATVAFSDKMATATEMSKTDSIQLENVMKEFRAYYKTNKPEEFKTAFEVAMLKLLQEKMKDQNKASAKVAAGNDEKKTK